MNEKQIVTNVGLNLPADCTEDQFFEAGRILANIEKGMQWAIGDWYNAIPCGDKKAACEKVGLTFKTAAQYGWVARNFQSSPRGELCSFNHYKVLAHNELSDDQRQDLLEQAQAQEKPWGVKRLTDERNKVLGVVPKAKKKKTTQEETPPPEQTQEEDEQMGNTNPAAQARRAEDGSKPTPAGGRRNTNARRTYEGVIEDEALMEGAPPDWEKRYKAYRERTTNRVQDRAEAVADTKLREKAQDLLDHLQRLEEENKRLRAGYKGLYEKKEYDLIRGILHTDKGEDPRKDKAFHLLDKNKDVLVLPPPRKGVTPIPRTAEELLKRRKAPR